ncbi:alternative ribosome rescue aminoacyl-tRNA hydrolase ArfB [Poritiphilus flavus]|uniref:Aminoacyl-tRNA hydrolase n=1 Tax=Poritiphilus flavus TaxID=2697053 RepID=A0A6L9ECL3_9FLAO|nr:alternative ribosome rescue aminoacyl-tRNA hydrolase ArfB [Poritiphilus flavus]NAS12436.1 aminoacyl-tRNA hydrolase [Poritiphilus flavus]
MNKEEIIRELRFKSVRSSGAGGQHVNKVATKVVLQFALEDSKALNEEEKILIKAKLRNRLNKDQQLVLHSDTTRSQSRNKALVTQQFLKLITEALKKKKIRKKTSRSRASIEKRLSDKRKAAEKKQSRQKPKL